MSSLACRSFLCATFIVVSASAARAQTPDPGTSPPGATPVPEQAVPSPPEAMSASDARDDAAWSLYHRAFAAASKGDWALVRQLSATLADQHPDHPATARTSTILSMRDRHASAGDAGDADTGTRVWPEPPSIGAKSELAILQTLSGIAIGIELCIVVECDSGEAFIGLPLALGSLALGGVLGVLGDISPGQRAAINTGTLWATYNAAMINAIAGTSSGTAIAGSLATAQIGGAVGGELLWRNLRLTEGQVALGMSGGFWASVMTALFIQSLDGDVDSDGSLTAILVAGDLGLVGGGFLARRFPDMSRGRTLVIDAGGLVGGLSGTGIAYLIGGDSTTAERVALATLVGASIGLSAATYFTRRWDEGKGVKSTQPQLTLLPTPGGGLSAGLSMTLDL